MKEVTITYIPISYEKDKNNLSEYEPIPESLWEHPQFNQHYMDMGNDGWELTNVQPLLRGMYKIGGNGVSGALVRNSVAYGYGYSLTAGYYFFWSREKK